MKPNRVDAYNLLQRGAVALSEITMTGMHVDVQYCKKKIKHVRRKIERARCKFSESDAGKVWRKKFRKNTNFDSNDQAKVIFYDEMGLTTEKKTKKGGDSTSAEALAELDLPEIKYLIEMRKLEKVESTYLGNILNEQIDGFVHPDFNLHTVRTYRSSSSRPNFQNLPIRDKEMGKIVRDAFLPRPGRRIAEIDFKALEVRVAACYHKDPVMLKYIRENYDMHLDMACECYALEHDQCTKITRYAGKNRFVFPEFYGAYYETVAPDLWKSVPEFHLETTDGVPMLQHLKEQGIGTFKKFKEHIKRVERHFWNKRFRVYDQWKKEWYSKYVKKGYFDTLTGFRCQGWMKRNDVINYPVQGSAFHCLLWCLCELHDWLKENGFKTCIIGQIHDSIVLDICPDEFDEIIEFVKKLTEKLLAAHWKWIIVPMSVELEATPVDSSWFNKEEIEI